MIDVPQETPVQESVAAEPEENTGTGECNSRAGGNTGTGEYTSRAGSNTGTAECTSRARSNTGTGKCSSSATAGFFGQQPVQPTQFTGQNSGQQPANNKPARFPKGIIAIVAAGSCCDSCHNYICMCGKECDRL